MSDNLLSQELQKLIVNLVTGQFDHMVRVSLC